MQETVRDAVDTVVRLVEATGVLVGAIAGIRTLLNYVLAQDRARGPAARHRGSALLAPRPRSSA